MRTLLACLMMSLIVSCAAPVAKNNCAWVKQIIVNDGDTITRPTAEQIVAHNRKVTEFCR